MKRVLILFFLAAILPRPSALAQDPAAAPASAPLATAATIAAREDAEDRYKRMAADLQAVQTDNEALHAKITAMEQEIQTLRDAQSHGPDTSSVQDDLKKLAQAIQEVDKKRLEDKDAISEEIRQFASRLESTLGSSPPPIVRATPDSKNSGTPESPAAENGYSYTIQSGDTLGAILSAYNKDFKSKGLKSITIRQAMEANPKVDWNRLRVGQKIVIPRPAGS